MMGHMTVHAHFARFVSVLAVVTLTGCSDRQAARDAAFQQYQAELLLRNQIKYERDKLEKSRLNLAALTLGDEASEQVQSWHEHYSKLEASIKHRLDAQQARVDEAKAMYDEFDED